MHFVCVCVLCMYTYILTYIHTTDHMWRSEHILLGSVLSFYSVGSGEINLRSLILLAGAFATETSHRLSAQFSTTEKIRVDCHEDISTQAQNLLWC